MLAIWGDARTWTISTVILGASLIAGVLAHLLLFSIAGRLARKKDAGKPSAFLLYTRKPASILLPLLGLVLAYPFAPIPDYAKPPIGHGLQLCVIGAIGWALIIAVQVIGNLINARYAIDVEDNLLARRVRTQTLVLQRVAIVTLVIVTGGVMLMTFPSVRSIGTSVLASAGILGVVVGMAARSTFASLIAGLQVAMTQPIRIDDAVVVEGEWGWIEEIEATYVVIRLWDLRRLIVPLTYFIEKPFQNWTRTTAAIIGTAMLYVDYSAPVEEVRKEFHRLLKETTLWDGKTAALQVTELTEKTMQLRAIMSASSSSRAFDLRCYVREKLISFLQEKYPGCLPRQREEQLTIGPQD